LIRANFPHFFTSIVTLKNQSLINYGGIPFELRAKQPNAQTLEAIQELEAGKGHSADDVDQLFKALGVGNDLNV
jgi:DNA-damage-inducible protein J